LKGGDKSADRSRCKNGFNHFPTQKLSILSGIQIEIGSETFFLGDVFSSFKQFFFSRYVRDHLNVPFRNRLIKTIFIFFKRFDLPGWKQRADPCADQFSRQPINNSGFLCVNLSRPRRAAEKPGVAMTREKGDVTINEDDGAKIVDAFDDLLANPKLSPLTRTKKTA
jgi:hypothetical protein